MGHSYLSNRFTRRRLVQLLLLGLAAFSLSVLIWIGMYPEFHNPSFLRSNLPVIRFGTLFRAIDYAPYYLAKKNGWFEDALKGKARVEHLPTFQSPPSASEALGADRVDVLMTADVPSIVARSAGVRLRIPMLSCTLNSQIVVKRVSDYRKLSDLIGKRVAVAFGTGPHYGLLKNLQQVSISKSKVELLNMIPPDAKAAFSSNAVDAWAIFPPYIEQEVLSGNGKVLENVTSPVQVVVSIREAMMVHNREIITIVLQQLERARSWIEANPKEAQVLMSKLLDLPLDVVQLSWHRLDWQTSLEQPTVQEDIQSKANFLLQEKFIKNPIDVRISLLGWPTT